MPELVRDAVLHIHHLPSAIKFLALVLAVFIEYIFPIFPGDTIVLLAGFLNAHGAIDLWEISLAIVVGSIVGALVAYGIGFFIANRQQRYPWFSALLTSENAKKFNIWYQKWGGLFLLFNRFFPGIRALFFIAAGATKISLTKVVTLGVLSAIIFNTCLVFLGYLLGYNAELIINFFYHYNAVAIMLILIIISCYVIYLVQKKRRR